MAGDGRDKGPNMMADVCIFSQENIHPCMMMSGMVEMWEDQCCCSVVRWLPPAPHHAGSSPHPHLPGRSSSSSSVRSSTSKAR